jgi:hypothetical protein
MPTPAEIIAAGPHKLAPMNGIVKINYLFENFRHYAKHAANWKYVASGQLPSGGIITAQAILDGTNQGVVYCDPLVQSFMKLAKDACPEMAGSITDFTIDPCLLAKGLTCIDPGVVGNLCHGSKTYAEVGQCLFTAKHVLCRVQQNYYDICFLTKVPKPEFYVEISGFVPPSHYKFPMLEGWRVGRTPPFRVFRPVPHGYPKAPGFDVSFMEVTTSSVTPGELKQLRDFAKQTTTPPPGFAKAFD